MTTPICQGIGVIIDDGIEPADGEEEDDIVDIIKKLDEKGIPTCRIGSVSAAYRFLPNLASVSFFMIDWYLFEPNEKKALGRAVPGAELKEEVYRRVIEFIQKLKEICFAPVLLFTKESENYVRREILPRLEAAGLFHKDGRDYIHVKTKSELLEDDKLLADIDSWVTNTPSIYVLVTWQKEMLKAKNTVFWNLYDRSRGWPIILWRSYRKEGEPNPSCPISDMLFRLVSSVATPPVLDENKLNLSTHFDPQEMMQLIRGTTLLEGNLSGVKPGDIFRIGDLYYLNIRPECDTMLREHPEEISKATENEPEWDGRLYLIKGKKMSGAELKNGGQYNKKYGFVEHVKDAFVPLATNKIGEVLVFDLTELEVKEYKEIKDCRICRLLPPYVTKIQQRFASCIGRIGVPRMPAEIEKEIIEQVQSGSGERTPEEDGDNTQKDR